MDHLAGPLLHGLEALVERENFFVGESDDFGEGGDGFARALVDVDEVGANVVLKVWSALVHVGDERDGAELASDFVVEVLLDAVANALLGIARMPALQEKRSADQQGSDGNRCGVEPGDCAPVRYPDGVHGGGDAIQLAGEYIAPDQIDSPQQRNLQGMAVDHPVEQRGRVGECGNTFYGDRESPPAFRKRKSSVDCHFLQLQLSALGRLQGDPDASRFHMMTVNDIRNFSAIGPERFTSLGRADELAEIIPVGKLDVDARGKSARRCAGRE